MPSSIGNNNIKSVSWVGSSVNDGLPVASNSQAAQVSTAIVDPLDHLISINGHGRSLNQTFELPQNVYLIIPHPKGLDKFYEFKLPINGLTLEELMYRNQDGKMPALSSGGWKVYFPKERVKDMGLSPWSESNNPEIEYKSWVHRVPVEDVQAIKKKDGKIPTFATVPARGQTQDRLQYHGKEKFKVKVFANTRLSTIIEELKEQQPEAPLVVIPFACNAGPKNNQSISCDLTTTIDPKALFERN